MARNDFVVTTEGQINVAANTTKTLLQIVTPTNIGVAVKGFSVTFDSSPGTVAPEVDLLIQTTAGTMSSATPQKEDQRISDSIQTTAQKTATAEPTAGAVLRRYMTQPGGFEIRFSEDDEIRLAGATRLGLRIINPAGATAFNATAHISAEE